MKTALTLAALAALGLTASAHADNLQTFDLTYSGAAFGNQASATGTVTLDLTQIANPGATLGGTPPDVTLTVTGASSGNGTFTRSDFLSYVFDTNGATLDLTRELVGQPTNNLPWGTQHFLTGDNATSGDFNLFPSGPGESDGAPKGVWYFTLATDNGQGDDLALTSFRPATATPEPASWAALGLGALGLLALARRARKSA